MNGINRYLMLFCIGLMLTACEESSDPVNLFPLPKQLQQRMLPDGLVLKAVARIPELSMETAMDIKNDQAMGFFRNLPAGTYTVKVTFSDAASGVVLATAKRQVEIGHSAGEVAFGEDDYVYPDDDGDRYSNLDEIRVKKNPADPDNFPIPRRVFITSDSGPADLSQWPDAGGKTGILAGDAICQTRADRANLDGTFRAWLSDDSNDAYCHIMGLGGKKGSCVSSTTSVYVRTDNFLVARSLDDLINDGEMYTAIQFDERGNDLVEQSVDGQDLPVWTGTNALGKVGGVSSGGHCNNWTSSSMDDRGGYGYGQRTRNQWTAAWDAPCGGGSRARLYCFQVTPYHKVVPQYKTASAKKVFVTSRDGSGDLSSWPNSGGKSGVDAGNAICENLARKAGYANADKFTAWLSGSVDDAIDLLQSDGPWARPDGVLVAEDGADLQDGSIFTSISQTEKGDYVFANVWTGTQSTGRNYHDAQGRRLICNDWSSSASSVQGKHGISVDTFRGWSDTDESWTLNCDEKSRLYCFERD
jgi:hypothetical protein